VGRFACGWHRLAGPVETRRNHGCGDEDQVGRAGVSPVRDMEEGGGGGKMVSKGKINRRWREKI